MKIKVFLITILTFSFIFLVGCTGSKSKNSNSNTSSNISSTVDASSFTNDFKIDKAVIVQQSGSITADDFIGFVNFNICGIKNVYRNTQNVFDQIGEKKSFIIN